MTGGSHIRAVGPDAAPDAQDEAVAGAEEETLALDEAWEESWEEGAYEPESHLPRGWIVPGLAFLAMAGWTGFFGWAMRTEILAGGTPQQWIGWIINWSVPVLLIATLWLLAMRNSRREAARFTDAAAALARESRELEGRLTVVNRELSLAREFLGAQSLELESLGRVASERISTHAGELQSLIQNNGAQVEAIAGVSTTALENMQKLRDDLPVIANSARDVSNQVGNAGRTAHEQVDKLIAGFDRLNQFGVASGKQVEALSAKVKETVGSFEEQVNRLDGLASERFDALKAKSEDFRVDLDSREVDALAAMRHRADELRAGLEGLRSDFTEEEDKSVEALRARLGLLRGEGEALSAKLRDAESEAFNALRKAKDRLHEEIVEVISNLDELDGKALAAAQARVKALHEEAGRFDDLLAARDARFNEEVARRQDQFDTRETQASEALAQRMADLDDALAEREQTQIEQAERLAEHGREIAEKVDQLNALFASVSTHASEAGEKLSTGLDGLDGRLAAQKENLDATGATLSELTDTSIRLLEIIQSGAKQSRDDLPRAIEQATEKLTGVEERALMLREVMDETGKRGDALVNYLITTQNKIESTDKNINEIQSRLSAHGDDNVGRLQNMQALIAEIEGSSERLSAHTSEKLQASIAQLLEASRSAFAMLENSAEDVVEKASHKIGERATDAIQRAIQLHSGSAIEEIEEASLKATQRGRDATIQLRDQLAKVNELAGNLEQRVNRARELAEEQVDHDFARRMALITDSLNSNAIDITRAMSADVTDTAWASYLKGDRGIFTRRAVRLIDNSEARDIVELFENDDDFREHVSRYIHDFEAMLRSLLSTRDGNALGVTILSSDMGKLYVALAQAIERLRN